MEGLLPLVYRAIKKRKTRRQYQCLSSGTALSYTSNIVEFYPKNSGPWILPAGTFNTETLDHHAQNIGHQRYNSVTDFSNAFPSPQQVDGNSPSSQK
ncbi:hypothetical protein VNO77_00673 [Canavalia gladiata]|uniref:Uncharacterized protein n=1 Tax=Canavalia gladiata TaxID=3824 RepID=A0AAN9MPU9_CANGL